MNAALSRPGEVAQVFDYRAGRLDDAADGPGQGKAGIDRDPLTRHADISDTQLWWIDTAMLDGGLSRGSREASGRGEFSMLQLRRVSLPAIVSQWDDMVRVAGSLATGQVRAYHLIRMMTVGGRSTGLGSAFAHCGRIFKTLHLLQVIHVEEYRRMVGAQVNTGESRQGLARPVYFGNLGRLTRGYERGMEDQLERWAWGLTRSPGGTPCTSTRR